MATREFSAGGVVVRERDGRFEVAVIKPQGRNVLALPKGHIDGEESAQQAATREVLEETGLSVELTHDLGDVKYVYRFRGQTIFKVVTFFLFRHTGGEIDVLDPAMRIEVDVARWVPLSESAAMLSYRGEKEMVLKALALITSPKGTI